MYGKLLRYLYICPDLVYIMYNSIINEKQRAIMETAHRLFWKHGFRRVSIEEICREARVSKMTFYRHFPDKLSLARTVYDIQIDEGLRKFRDILSSDLSPREKVEHMLKMKAESVHGISPEFLRDFYNDRDTGLKAHIEEKTAATWQVIMEDFRQAQRQGIFRDDFDPQFLLYMTQRFTDHLNDPYLLQLLGSAEKVVMEMTRLLTFGICAPHHP